MIDYTSGTEQDEMDRIRAMGEQAGAPAGARQNVRRESAQGAVARPGGATQNSGGAIANNEDEAGPEGQSGPGRGAD